MSVTKVQLVGNVSTGASFAGLNVVGVLTATSFSGDGSGLTGVGLGTTGSINTSGIITASSFFGSGANLTGVSGVSTTGSVNTSGIITATSIVVSAGTTALPSISPTGDSNTGIFFPSTDTIAVSAGGTERLRVDTTASTSTLPVVHPLGAVGTPSLTFAGDLNTGIYSPGADQVAVATNGIGRLFVNSTGKIIVGGSTPLGLLNLVKVDLPSGVVTYTSAEVNGKAQAGLNWYQDQLANYEYYLDVFATATSEAPWGGSNIRFLTTLNGTATASEAMRINRHQELLVGYTSDNGAYKLQVNSQQSNLCYQCHCCNFRW